MLDRILTPTDVGTVVSRLARRRRIIGPVRRNGRFFYETIDTLDHLDLDFTYCVYSPKAFLFPPRETLFTFDQRGGSFSAEPMFDETEQAIVGVHPCDVHAIRLLDHVFSVDTPDAHYLTRRRRTFILAVDCDAPCTDGVFCRDMGGHEASDGFDLMCYPVERESDHRPLRYAVQFGSEAGREAVLYARVGHAPTIEDKRAFDRYRDRKQNAFPRRLACDGESLPNLLEQHFNSSVWSETASRCYSCGSCNLVCPTCYCFDMQDETALDGCTGRRVREWDGCQLPAFAVVAGGHDFRPKPEQRLRHRINRKGRWIRDRTGLAGCTGCARCDRACTAKICSVDIYNQLAAETSP